MQVIRLFVTIAIVSAIIGCQNNAAPNNTADNRENDMINVRQTHEREDGTKNSNEVAEHLVELASSVPNVNNATAVVAGPYAVIGINVDEKLDRSKVGTIKYTVAESLHKDPYGKNAVVVADPDTVQRLQDMSREIRQGQPIGGIMEELAAIVGRVMPEFPQPIRNTPPDPTEVNDDQMNGNEEQNLEKEQQDQSKNQMKNRQPNQKDDDAEQRQNGQ